MEFQQADDDINSVLHESLYAQFNEGDGGGVFTSNWAMGSPQSMMIFHDENAGTEIKQNYI